MASNTKRTKEEEVLIWAGVIAQLNRTRSNQLLVEASIPYPLFVLLRHFSHNVEREWTISALTAAFETSQSGMTKQVQKLLSHGYIDSRPDDEDGRMKWFRLNEKGSAMLESMSKTLRRDHEEIFESWAQSDVDALHHLLFRLKCHLDENRL